MQETLADLMTKPVPAAQFDFLRSMMGITKPRSAESSGSVVIETPRQLDLEQCT